MMRILVAACALAASMPAAACLFISNYRPFPASPPATASWENAPVDAALPPPQVTVEEVRRAPPEPTDYVSRISACLTGNARLRVQWPRSATPALGEIGFYFAVPKDGPIAPEGAPQAGTIDGDTMLFDFYLFEGPAALAEDLDVPVDVYAVDANGRRGPATRVRVQAPARR